MWAFLQELGDFTDHYEGSHGPQLRIVNVQCSVMKKILGLSVESFETHFCLPSSANTGIFYRYFLQGLDIVKINK